MPSTTGRRSRGAAEPARDDQRARGLAEARGQRRRHQHADRRALQRVATRGRAPGSAARRIACQETRAQRPSRAHISAEAERAPRPGSERSSASRDRGRSADALRARAARARRRRPSDGERAAARARRAARGARAAGGRGLERGQAARRDARRPSAGASAEPRRRPRVARARRARGDARSRPRRPSTHLARRRAARRSARRARRAAARHARARARGSSARSRSASASAVASPRGTSRPSTPSRDDVAVAGDVRGDDRRAGRERLGQHHAEALAAERRRAEHVGRARARRCFALVVDACRARVTPRAVEQQRRDLLRRRADDRQLGGDVLAQRLEGAQQHRQALALDGLADERRSAAARPARAPRGARRRRRRAASTPLGMTR